MQKLKVPSSLLIFFYDYLLGKIWKLMSSKFAQLPKWLSTSMTTLENCKYITGYHGFIFHQLDDFTPSVCIDINKNWERPPSVPFNKGTEGVNITMARKENANPVFIYWPLYTWIHLALPGDGWVSNIFVDLSWQTNRSDLPFVHQEFHLPVTLHLSYFNHLFTVTLTAHDKLLLYTS